MGHLSLKRGLFGEDFLLPFLVSLLFEINLFIGRGMHDMWVGDVFFWNSLPTEILEFPTLQLKFFNLDIEIRGS